MSLLYKTRSGDTPNGKPYLYFSGHPKDRELYFEEISGDILALHDVAIWYDDSDAHDSKAQEKDIKLMRLIILPITHRLLSVANRGLEEFEIASRNNIPILPIMLEDGLAERFNSTCGDIQYLDKYSVSDGAISFAEKLEKFLSSVIVGDEFVERVRSAFDAYVFLSYRKKDRLYANRLMELIHENDFCRDIAIWYDEFLVPGENFNDAISDAIAKSSLFVMAVTPNIVNEVNYVMTTEYPMALKNKMQILPVMLSATDSGALASRFPELPVAVDAYDTAELKKALERSLRAAGVSHRPRDSVHDFFMGLAYLGGIDVEINGERARELLTQAAEGGVALAMHKLSDMYRRGNRIPRDNGMAVEWLKKYVDCCKTNHLSRGRSDDPTTYADALVELGELLAELVMIEDARAAYLEAAEVLLMALSEDATTHDTNSVKRKLAGVYINLAGFGRNLMNRHYINKTKVGILAMTNEYVASSLEYYGKALELLRELSCGSSDENLRIMLCRCYNGIGDTICDEDGDRLLSAGEYYAKALDICAEDDSMLYTLVETKMSLARLKDKLFDRVDFSDRDEIIRMRTECILAYIDLKEIGERVLSTVGEAFARRLMIDVNFKIGSYCSRIAIACDGSKDELYFCRRVFEIAEQYASDAWHMAETMFKESGSPAARILSAKALCVLGDIYHRSPYRNAAKALAYLEGALVRFEEQLEVTDVFDVRSGIENCHLLMGRVFESEGRIDDADRHYRLSNAITNSPITVLSSSEDTAIVFDPFLEDTE